MKCVTAVWLALAVLPSCRPARPPLGGSLEFRDSDWRMGQLGGHVIYRPRTGERMVSFHLYWGTSNSKRLTQTPIVAWSRVDVPPYSHFVDSPRPAGATHWLLYAVDERGNELEPAFVLEIRDNARTTRPFRVLPVRCDHATEDASPLVFRSGEELIREGVVCSTQLGQNVDFSNQSLVHFQLTWACPAESGSRVLGVTQDRARNVRQVHVHVWSSNESQAACHRSYWLAVDPLPLDTAVEVVRFSPCDHPKDCTM